MDHGSAPTRIPIIKIISKRGQMNLLIARWKGRRVQMLFAELSSFDNDGDWSR
jgi:hypothetical protein